MTIDEKMEDEENFTILPFDSPSNKFSKGIISIWVFALAISLAGIWQVTFGSSKDCKDTACSLGEITSLSIGLMCILVGGFIAFVGFLVLVKTRERDAATIVKEETILRQVLNDE